MALQNPGSALSASMQEGRMRLHPADCSPQLCIIDDGRVAAAPDEACFTWLRFDGRADYGAPSGVALIFEMTYERQFEIDTAGHKVPHSCRIGFSSLGDQGELGKEVGWAYGSSGKNSCKGKFVDSPFGSYNVGDTVAACLEWLPSGLSRFTFFVNGKPAGGIENDQRGQTCVPHVNVKNTAVRLNFDRARSPFASCYPPTVGFGDELLRHVRLAPNPVPKLSRFEECVVFILQGVPASGKSTMARRLSRALPGVAIVSTNQFINDFKFVNLRRKHAYDQRFDRSYDMANKAFDATLKSVVRRPPRHYIIDQTNCHRSARIRKLGFFCSFGARISIVCLPPLEQWVDQLKRAVHEDHGKHIPLDAWIRPSGTGVRGFLSHWEFPSTEEEPLTDIIFVGCRPEEGDQRVQSYREHVQGGMGPSPFSHGPGKGAKTVPFFGGVHGRAMYNGSPGQRPSTTGRNQTALSFGKGMHNQSRGNHGQELLGILQRFSERHDWGTIDVQGQEGPGSQQVRLLGHDKNEMGLVVGESVFFQVVKDPDMRNWFRAVNLRRASAQAVAIDPVVIDDGTSCNETFSQSHRCYEEHDPRDVSLDWRAVTASLGDFQIMQASSPGLVQSVRPSTVDLAASIPGLRVGPTTSSREAVVRYFRDGEVRRSTSRSQETDVLERDVCAKLDAFFRASIPGLPTCLPSKGTVWYRDKALVTRCFYISRTDAYVFVKQGCHAALSVWISPAPQDDAHKSVTVCVSTQDESEDAAHALA